MRPSSYRAPFGAAFTLGFALSGFFDGVLLHQILQWHHLLSLIDRPALQPLHVQVLADGLFHGLMYIVAVGGLVWLWRSRAGLAADGGSRRLWGGVLLGFGVWNLVDIVVFHVLLRLHHVRLDTDMPWAWDAGWFLGLGVLPVLLGLAVLGRPSRPKAGSRSFAVLVALVAGLGGWSLRPPPADADTLVLFRPGANVMAAVVAADARLVQLDATGTLAVVRLPDGASAFALYRGGALMVQGTGPSGCFTWARRSPQRARSL